MGPEHLHRAVLKAVAALLAMAPIPALAASTYWTNPAGGLFTEANNWYNGLVPGVLDHAIFDESASKAYTVRLASSYKTYRLTVRTAPVILNLAGAAPVTYTIAAPAAFPVVIGESPDDSGDLTLTGGTVVAAATILGNASGASGELTVAGPGAVWNNSASLTVGSWGSGTLNVQAGGHLTSASGWIAAQAGSDATVIVDGAGSSWVMSGLLFVGDGGMASMTLSGGALVRSNGITLAEGDFASLTVEGSASLQSLSHITLGPGPSSLAALTVQKAGKVTSESAILAKTAGGTSWVTLDGVGSNWTIKTGLSIGYGGSGTMEVANGAVLSAPGIALGELAGSDGVLEIEGVGSKADATGGTIFIGLGGNGNLNIGSGASVVNAVATLGKAMDSFGSANVVGPSSSWTMSSQLTVAGAGSGVLDISNGGAVAAAAAVIGQESASDGAVTVTDAGSSWSMPLHLTVGYRGHANLDIANGARVSSGIAAVGATPTGSGVVDVAGNGSSWACSALYIGGDGLSPQGSGQVTVSAGATVSAASSIVIWPAGKLILDQGTVTTPIVYLKGGLIAGAGALLPPLRITTGQINVDASRVLSIGGSVTSADGGAWHKTGAGVLRINGVQSHGSGAILSIDGGAVDMTTDAGAAGANLTINVADGATVNFGVSQHLAGLRLGFAGRAAANMPVGSRKLLHTRGLSINATSGLDLFSSGMIVQAPVGSGPEVRDQVAAWIAQARNSPGGRWLGPGITSSAARSDTRQITTLGVILNDKGGNSGPICTLFDLQPVDINSVLVKYTWNGDANLDGVVNADDYFQIDSGFISQKKGWYNGDFNYDGVVNADDYFLIDSVFIAQSGPMGIRVARVVGVPEPGVLSGCVLGVMLLGGRVRRGTRTR